MTGEREVLGAILLDNRAWDDVSAIISAPDFSDLRCRRIWGAIGRLLGRHTPADLATVAHEFEGEDDVAVAYIADLTSVVPSAGNALYYARQVRDTAVRRRIRELASEMVGRTADMSVTADDLIGELERGISDIQGQGVVEYEEARDLISPAMDRYRERYESHGDLAGLSTGIPSLDELTRGLQPKKYVLLGARTSIGKSALGIQIAEYVARSEPVGFVSLEMPNDENMDRLFCVAGRLDSQRLATGMFRESDFADLSQAADRIGKGRLYLYDRPGARIHDVRSVIRRMHAREGIRVAFVDYVGLIEPADRRVKRHEQLGEVSVALKTIAMELGITVVAMAQLNRGAEGRRPSLSDLRESGSLEQDADQVILLHRERESDQPAVPTECIVAKHRGGPVGVAHLVFVKACMRFEEEDRDSVRDYAKQYTGG